MLVGPAALEELATEEELTAAEELTAEEELVTEATLLEEGVVPVTLLEELGLLGLLEELEEGE